MKFKFVLNIQLHSEECTIAAAFSVWLSWEVEAQKVVLFMHWGLLELAGKTLLGRYVVTFSSSPGIFTSMASTQWPVLIFFLCNYFTYCILWCGKCICVLECRNYNKSNWICLHTFSTDDTSGLGGRLRAKGAAMRTSSIERICVLTFSWGNALELSLVLGLSFSSQRSFELNSHLANEKIFVMISKCLFFQLLHCSSERKVFVIFVYFTNFMCRRQSRKIMSIKKFAGGEGMLGDREKVKLENIFKNAIFPPLKFMLLATVKWIHRNFASLDEPNQLFSFALTVNLSIKHSMNPFFNKFVQEYIFYNLWIQDFSFAILNNCRTVQ